MQVVYAEPGKLLRMHGGLGPLQSLGVAGSLTWQVSELPAGSQITLSYNVGGYLPDGLDAWAKPVESVLAEQLGRLARHLGQVTDGQGQDHPQGEPEEHGSGQTGAPREE